MQGYYRLTDHPNAEAVSLAAILRPNHALTIRQRQVQRRVLSVHDRTALAYTGLARDAAWA